MQTPFDGSGRVRISFPAKACPSRVVFVLKETEPEAWLNSGAGDFVAQLKPPDLTDLVDKVIEAESTYTHWSLFNRFCMANDILDAADAAGETSSVSAQHTSGALPRDLMPMYCLLCLPATINNRTILGLCVSLQQGREGAEGVGMSMAANASQAEQAWR